MKPTGVWEQARILFFKMEECFNKVMSVHLKSSSRENRYDYEQNIFRGFNLRQSFDSYGLRYFLQKVCRTHQCIFSLDLFANEQSKSSFVYNLRYIFHVRRTIRRSSISASFTLKTSVLNTCKWFRWFHLGDNLPFCIHVYMRSCFLSLSRNLLSESRMKKTCAFSTILF